MVGKGSVRHNNRDFTAENVDAERTKNNITYCNENIKDVYHKLFDKALDKFNARQTRKDRMIDDYYEKIRIGKQEKLFHEVILQIGNWEDMNAASENGQLSKTILDKYMKTFQERNPNLYVFSAHLHMDEATPHLHIDFVPFTTGSKRGLETRVSLKKALEAQGFVGKGRSDTEWNRWVYSEKEKLSEIMLEYGIEWDKKGTHDKHRPTDIYKRDMFAEEVEQLEAEKNLLEAKISTYKNSEEYALITVQKLNDNKDFEITEPPPFMSAKTYKTKYVEPFIKKLVKMVQNLARRCYRAERAEQQSAEKISILTDENQRLKSRVWDLNLENSRLRVELRNFDKIKDFLGIDKIKEILKTINKTKYKKRSDISR
jgi:hypothetical protein